MVKPGMTISGLMLCLTLISTGPIHAQDEPANTSTPPAQESAVPVTTPAKVEEGEYNIFNDKELLNGYFEEYQGLSKDILIEMIKDDTLSPFKSAAAVKIFKEKFAYEMVSREKRIVEKVLLRALNRTDSPFVQVEILHTLCRMDRYRYFKAMVPVLIQKLNHYNINVNEMAYNSLEDILMKDKNPGRIREARIVFNTLRKILFLSRQRLAKVTKPDEPLTYKLKLLRWSMKILGTQQIKYLPKEVINLL